MWMGCYNKAYPTHNREVFGKERIQMKRFLALFLTIVMLLAMFASCKPETPEETTPEVTTPEVTTPEATTPEETTPDEGGTIIPPKKLSALEILETLNPAQQFEATFDCQEAIIKDVASIDALRGAFTNEGFTKLEVNMVEGAKFETILLTRDDELVTIYWIPADKEARVMIEKADADALSVLQKNSSTDGGTLTMVQIGVARGEAVDNPMIGMCYVFKLSNGNAMIIDGGYYYDDCAHNLYKAFAKLDIAKTEDEKYIIEAWIFTHGHGDHNGVLNNFVPLYGDKVDVTYFLYQLPTNDEISAVGGGKAGEAAFHELCQTAYPNATIINPHVGLNYYFGNATVSMLYTPDVLWATDNKLTYYNNTSLIFKVGGGGTSFLCMGDAGEKAAARSWDLFEDVAYESGILQITHHGLTTDDGSNVHVWDNIKNIYQAAHVSYAVLPMGTRQGESSHISGNWTKGNGRWAVIFQYGYNGGQMSMFVKLGDAPTSSGYFNHELLTRLVATAETGTNYLVQMSSYYAGVTTLHGYDGLNTINNGNGITTYISSRDKEDMATVFQFAKGVVTVKKNQVLSEWLKLPEKNAIDIVTALNPTATFESTAGNTEAVIAGVADVQTVLSAFKNAKFYTVTINSVMGAKFKTYLLSNGTELVTVYYKPDAQEARVIWEKLDESVLLPVLSANNNTGKGELTLIQVGVERGPGDTGNPMIGMCYVVKLSDGRAIIIDGGFNYENNADNLFGTLSKVGITKNAAGQYQIAAWIFSHGDGDHIGIMTSMGDKYSEKIDVEYIVHHLPTSGVASATSGKGETAFIEKCKDLFPNAIHLIPRAGTRYFIGNAIIDMLYTPDLVWSPESKITYYNSTSLVFKINGGGVSFLSTGDAGESAFKAMWESYESTTFDCDLFQVPHHGLTTQNTEDGTGNYAAHGWTYIKKVFDATGAKYAVIPMGDRNPNDSRNGRATVIVFWGSANCVISYFMNKDDKSIGTPSAENYQAFVDSVAAGTNTHQTYLGYNGINILNNGKGLTTYMASSETAPMATLFTFANGNLTVAENLALESWIMMPNQTEAKFESTFDSQEEVYINVKNKELFVNKFLTDGYTLLEVNNVEGARFETILLQKGSELVVLYWFSEDEEMRVIYDTIDPDSLTPLKPNAETGKGEVTIIQIGIERDNRFPSLAADKGNPQIGMCYIMKLSNGRAIVIDGGFNYATNADNLYNALAKLEIAKNAADKYIIEAWIFSHGHSDHNGIMNSFGEKYASKTEVNYILYQLPTNKAISGTGAGVAGEAAFHELCKKTFPDATYILPHANLKYYFGNAAIDVLYTPDLIWSPSNRLPDYNDTSIVTRWNAGGTAFLSFGDAGEIPATALWKYYGVSAFKSSILQITHHGLTTGANESQEWRNLKKVYEGAEVDFAFLPMGAAYGERNGRWSVLCGWGYTGGQASFALNRKDNAAGVDHASYVNFVNGIRDGSIKDKTYLGYDGVNIIDNGEGRITYIASSEDVPMATMFTFADGEATLVFNTKLYTWLEN